MTAGAYVVVSFARGFLALEGPFAYPRWMGTVSSATRLTWAQAHAYAVAYGGEVQPFHV